MIWWHLGTRHLGLLPIRHWILCDPVSASFLWAPLDTQGGQNSFQP